MTAERAHRCFGFVTYEKETSALNAIDNMHNNTLPQQSNILKVTSAPKPKGANTAGTNKPSSLFSLRPSLVLRLSPQQSGPTRTGSRRMGQTCQLPFRKNEIALFSPDFTPLSRLGLPFPARRTSHRDDKRRVMGRSATMRVIILISVLDFAIRPLRVSTNICVHCHSPRFSAPSYCLLS